MAELPKLRSNEFAMENGQPVDLSRLVRPRMDWEHYVMHQRDKPLACADILIAYGGGLLLVLRKGLPQRGIPWPIGGELLKGVPFEEFLNLKAMEECGLTLSDFVALGYGRVFSQTDPCDHGCGTDGIGLRFFARGHGELKLNELHEKPMIITPADYTPEFRAGLHDYVRKFMDLAMPLI